MNVIQIPTIEDIKIAIREELSKINLEKKSTPDKFIGKEEVAALLGNVSLSTVDNLRRKGILKSYKIGSSVRFLSSEVLTAIKTN